MKKSTRIVAAIALLLASTLGLTKSAHATAFDKLPYYSLTNPSTVFSVTVHFGLGPSDAYGNRSLYAYITDTDLPGFANRVAAPGNVTLNGYITVGSYSTYGQITIPGGQTYGSVSLGYVGTGSVTISSASLAGGTTIGGLPAYISTSIGYVYP